MALGFPLQVLLAIVDVNWVLLYHLLSRRIVKPNLLISVVISLILANYASLQSCSCKYQQMSIISEIHPKVQGVPFNILISWLIIFIQLVCIELISDSLFHYYIRLLKRIICALVCLLFGPDLIFLLHGFLLFVLQLQIVLQVLSIVNHSLT